MRRLTHISLFSGIGGIDLAADWAGFETVTFCEQNKYCQQILNKHWPDVPVIEDIHNVTADGLIQRGIDTRNITLVSGGFPCQPFSVAGNQKGKDDDRYLWPEMLRVIRELKPAWVLGENVPGIINMALEQVGTDLETEGYEVQPLVIPACGVGAWHRRARVFIVGHRASTLENSNCERCGKQKNVCEQSRRAATIGTSKALSDADCTQRKRMELSVRSISEYPYSCGDGWWATEPAVGRVAHGIPHRVDRLRALGNAVVPQQVYPILKAMALIEREMQCDETD